MVLDKVTLVNSSLGSLQYPSDVQQYGLRQGHTNQPPKAIVQKVVMTSHHCVLPCASHVLSIQIEVWHSNGKPLNPTGRGLLDLQ